MAQRWGLTVLQILNVSIVTRERYLQIMMLFQDWLATFGSDLPLFQPLAMKNRADDADRLLASFFDDLFWDGAELSEGGLPDGRDGLLPPVLQVRAAPALCQGRPARMVEAESAEESSADAVDLRLQAGSRTDEHGRVLLRLGGLTSLHALLEAWRALCFQGAGLDPSSRPVGAGLCSLDCGGGTA